MPETNTIYTVDLNNSPVENVTIEKNDAMYVMDGGTASGTTVKTGGSMTVSEGGKASSTVVNGSLTVLNGGSANVVNVDENGELYVSGRVTTATVSQGGSATVYEDGTAHTFDIDGGELNLMSGAYVFKPTGSGASVVSNNVIVQNKGSLFLFDGTRIEGVEMKTGGYASIDGGASMTSAIFSSGASATVRDGALVSKAAVNDGAVLTIASGGEVRDATLNAGGKITGNMYNCTGLKSNAGIIDFNIVVSDPEEGYLINDLQALFDPKANPMTSFYTVTATIDQGNGTYKLIEDASVFDADKVVSIVNYYNSANVLGTITLDEGTKTIEERQYTLNLSSDNKLTLTVSGAPDITGDLYEPFDLTEGMLGSAVDVQDGGYLNIYGGASAVETTVHSGGYVNVHNGGLASDTTVESGGIMNVSAGGVADTVSVVQGGRLNIREGGSAVLVRENGGMVNDVGSVSFAPNTFTGLTLDDRATVHSGTTANKTTIGTDGYLYVSSGGLAVNTTVNANGSLLVSSGGVADGLYAMANGGVTVSGGTLTGWLFLMAGAVVATFEGATIDFDLAQTKAGAASPLVNNLSLVSGAPDFTLTVTGFEAEGKYNLAAYAADFDKTITVRNSSGREFGTLTVGGEALSRSGRSYTLALDGSGNLSVTVGFLPADVTGDIANESVHLKDGQVGGAINVNNDGRLYVSEGGFARETTVNSDGDLYIEEGGAAEAVTVNSDGDIYIEEGGAAEAVNVNSGGRVFIYGGGEAYRVMEDGGYVYAFDGAKVTFVPNTIDGLVVENGDSASVHSGTTATNPTVKDGCVLEVTGGGSATGIVAEEGAFLSLAVAPGTFVQGAYAGSAFEITGGAVTGLAVHSGFNLDVSSGGVVRDTPVGTNGYLTVSSGGVASDTTVKKEGNLFVCSGGTASGVDVQSDGRVFVREGGSATGIVAADGADFSFVVAPGTYMQGTYAGSAFEIGSAVTGLKVNSRFSFDIGSGGTAVDTTVESGSYLNVSSGGTAGNTTVENGGYLFVRSGGTAHLVKENGGLVNVSEDADVTFVPNTIAGLVVNEHGHATLHSGTTATGTTLEDGGYLVLFGGSASDTTVNGGRLEVSSGGVAEAVTVNPGGIFYICPDGTAHLVRENGGEVHIQDDDADVTFASNTFTGLTLNKYECATVHSGTTAANTNIAAKGRLNVYDGGRAQNTTVNGDGELIVSSGGVVDGLYVMADGDVYVHDGTLTGWLLLAAGAVVSAFEGTTVDFDLSQTAAGAASPLVNDLSLISGDPSFTLTVDGTEADGTYKLAGNVATFGETITVFNTSGTELGTISIADGTKDIGGTEYTLNLNAHVLSVDLVSKSASDTTPPTVSNIAASTTEPTNGSVTVTAVFSDDVELKSSLYRIDDGAWQDYPSGGVVVTENATVYFKAVDTSDNECKPKFITIDNIDKAAPTVTVMPSTTDPATSVTLTAVFSDNVGVTTKQYRIGDGAWQDYTGPVTLTVNKVVYFHAADAAGNETTEICKVANIGNEPANDWLYRKGKWNSDANIATFTMNDVVALAADKSQMIYLDTKGSVESEDGKYNSVGRTQVGEETREDASDYAKIELAYGAALQFSVDSEVGGTFYVYEKTQDKKGNDIAKQRQKITVKADRTSPAKLATIYLEAGEYFVGMEAKLPSAKKFPEYSAYYNVQLTGTKLFENADGGWNDHAYALDADGKEDKFHLDPVLESKALDFKNCVAFISMDDGAIGADDWVGFSDATDYRMLTLKDDVRLTLNLNVTGTETGTGKAKLTIWKVSTNAKTGRITLSSKGSVTVKQGETGSIKKKFLTAGDYFISVTSTDAKKGGDVSYNLKVDEQTVFFDQGDNSDDWKYLKTEGAAGDVGTFGSAKVKSTDTLDDWVGYGDAVDYKGFAVDAGTTLVFGVSATDATKFTVYELVSKTQKDKTTYSLKKLQPSVTLKETSKGSGDYQGATSAITFTEGGTYYFSMESTNAKKYGNASYHVMVGILGGPDLAALTGPETASAASALAMPETSDSLAMADSLSFDQYDADVLADVSGIETLGGQSDWLKLGSLA